MTPRRAHSRGITLLEIMIVLAIIGMGMFLVRAGFRSFTKADLVDAGTELSAVLKRTSQLAIEMGEIHRVVIDLDQQNPDAADRLDYVVEVCHGQGAITRNEAVRPDEEATKRALEKGQQRLEQLPSDALATGDPDEAMKRTLAVAGHHVMDRKCEPAGEGFTGDSTGKKWGRALQIKRGIKFKQVLVQHRDQPVTKGQVAIYFFPTGSAEKAIVELSNGDDVFSVLVFGLTGHVELRDGALKDVDDHMMRNVMGDKDAKRETE